MNVDTNALDRVCMKIRSVTITDDVGLHHRINKYCGALLKPSQMYCDRCEDELAHEAERRVEIQR